VLNRQPKKISTHYCPGAPVCARSTNTRIQTAPRKVPAGEKALRGGRVKRL
jgi:hypothetical protein